ncbi:D-TA family PLP-dependent enzyme [Robiginitalea aurantiaca]|uniref:D-TA family PLP-dependent enzyme n=1 Tax=Robiginitalea aurantiaca TaxID=3056915 RepID=A0ABT7WEP4_9FLAO|nr:D-TA family PLP-dependent enzyme [Robiginitalea aurantiaca]MDM9631398.1 D-TA family PLP-dependent enzyme [Robiginitalea aurantiaca]
MDPETQNSWYALKDTEQIDSPALLIYPERIAYNIGQMLKIAGSPDRLRPHIKTHKMAEIIGLQQEVGIRKFKCATLAEAELLARCKAGDVLVAYPLIGPGIRRMARLQKKYPHTRFSCLVDNLNALNALEKTCEAEGVRLGVFIDLNVGMNRTGISPGPRAAELYRSMSSASHLDCRGIHLYDGHLRNPDRAVREKDCDTAFKSVETFRETLRKEGLNVPVIIAGGSPTFPIHAKREGVELSPGTTLLWDARYGAQFPVMPFLPAAVVLCRLISKPAQGIFCLDLGHKAVAAEMDFPRIYLPQLPENKQISQSEEHLVIESEIADTLPVGMVFYAIPMHICPTVIKYPKALTVEQGVVTGSWKIAARDYHLQD